jgi:hypothetical protein
MIEFHTVFVVWISGRKNRARTSGLAKAGLSAQKTGLYAIPQNSAIVTVEGNGNPARTTKWVQAWEPGFGRMKSRRSDGDLHVTPVEWAKASLPRSGSALL